MASLISPETYQSIKSLSKEYKITSNSTKPGKNKQLIRSQLSELFKKHSSEADLELCSKLKLWLKSLPQSTLYSCFSTYNPLICNFLIQMNLKNISDFGYDFALVENPEKKIHEFELSKLFYMRRKNLKNKEDKLFTEKDFERVLRFLDTEDYLDTLAVEGKTLKNLDKLFVLFDAISDRKAFTVPCKVYWENNLKKWMYEYPFWLKPAYFHSLADWACACLERGVWAKFWQMNGLDPRYPEETMIFCPNDKILHSVETVLTLPGFLRTVGRSAREDLIGDLGSLTRVFQEVKQKLGNCNPSSFVAKNSSNSTFFVSSLDSEKNYQNSKSVELVLHTLMHSSEEVFIEFLLCSPLERTATILDLTARIIALRIKEMHTQKIAEEILQEEHPPLAIEKKPKKKKKKNNKNRNKDPSIHKEEIKLVSENLLKTVMNSMYEFIDSTQNSKDLYETPLEEYKVPMPDEVLQINDNEFQIVNQKKKIRRLQPQQKIRDSIPEHHKSIHKYKEHRCPPSPPKAPPTKQDRPSKSLWERPELPADSTTSANPIEFPPLSSMSGLSQNQGALHQEIVRFVSNNTAKIEKKAQYINVIINKMNLIVAEMFSGSIFLYGSYATGLAIDSSDVDIGISTAACFTRESVQKACLDLGSFLEKLPFVITCQKIITAKVPVVKLEVDLLCYSGTSCKVMFDLTFMNYLDGGHCGLLAINFTKDLMILFPHIQYLAIVLKSFLYSHKLNSAYHGNL